MFKLEDFDDNLRLKSIVSKFNKFLSKNKTLKVQKILEELISLLDDPDSVVSVSYILSIIAEQDVNLISEKIINKIKPFFKSVNNKLKINSIIIIGFFTLANMDHVKEHVSLFIKLLIDGEEDVRENGLFFLQEFIKESPQLMKPYKNILLKALSMENKKENFISLLTFLEQSDSLKFKQLYNLREIIKELISQYFNDKESLIFKKITDICKKFYHSFWNDDIINKKKDDMIDKLDNTFLMSKFRFSSINKKNPIHLKDFIKIFKRSRLKDKEIYFYLKDKNSRDLKFFELEKEKLISFFEKKTKISHQAILDAFSSILEENELKPFMKLLIQLGHVKGYFSKFYFYPLNYLETEIKDKFLIKGIVNLKDYAFLPPEFVILVLKKITGSSSKIDYLLGKNGVIYYNLKMIKDQINVTAAKSSSIDLKAYRDRLTDENFIKLIKNLPNEYLTRFRKGTNWLTNIGQIKIKTEIENSRIVGFIDIKKISERLVINKLLIMDILDIYVDLRSGIWDMTMEVFYYSKYIREKIEKINLILDNEEKKIKANLLAKELNIDKTQILTKIDENIQLIGEEIKKQDEIKINDYLEKLGMDRDAFMSFIAELGLNYLRKEDILILNPKRIEDSKKGFMTQMINRAQSSDYISFGNFDMNSDIIESLIRELSEKGKIQGIFHEEQDEILFYTEKGIRNLMLENSLLFSFHDLFYEKDLTEKEIKLIRAVFDDLVSTKKLMGEFDEENLTFSSSDVIFAQDYNKVVDRFGRTINKYIRIFDSEFEFIKGVLIKKKEIISPQEIRIIQEKIDKINLNYVRWKAHLEAFSNTANVKLLKDQGYTLKKYNGLAEDKREEIKLFKEDPDVYDYNEGFLSWIKLFNELEINYGKIIFLQKKLIKNPDDEESIPKLEELLINLHII